MKNKIDFALGLLADIVCEVNYGKNNNAKFNEALKSWKWPSSSLENIAGISERELQSSYDKDDEDEVIYNEVSNWFEKFNY